EKSYRILGLGGCFERAKRFACERTRESGLPRMSTAPAVAEGAMPSARPPVLVRVSGMAKAFGATQALRDASFELLAGEVHALVGENGSGKSTLVKILSGVHAPDSGSIELSGSEVPAPRTPRVAEE